MRTTDLRIMGCLAACLAQAAWGCGGSDTDTTSGTTSGDPCQTAADCPPSKTECREATCNAGVCGFAGVAAGTPIAAQFAGDCRRDQCDGKGGVETVPDDADVLFGGVECAQNSCKDGKQVTTYAPAGTMCGEAPGLTCDGIGLCTAPACGGPIGFPGLPALDTGHGPRALAVADFDADGLPDLAVANETGDDAAVHFNLGQGRFTAPKTLVTGGGPNSVAAADFDGDGLMDLVFTDGKDDDLSILFNNGNGSFAFPVHRSVPYDVRAVTAADLDGDGTPDLAVTSNAPGQVSVMLNQGNGTFGPSAAYDADLPGPIAAVDVSGDGLPDLVVGDYLYGSDSIEVFVNQGGGVFGPSSPYGDGALTASVVGADLDGDGDTDLAVAHLRQDGQDFLQDFVGVFLNKGNGTFDQGTNYLLDSRLTSLAAADFDGDGDIDLAATIGEAGRADVLLNEGNGTFAAPAPHIVGDGPSSGVASDLDGDGKIDLAVANAGDDRLQVLLNPGDARFPAPFGLDLKDPGKVGGVIALTVADVTGDGKPDLLAGIDYNQSWEVSVWPGQGDGSFGEPTRYEAYSPRSIAVTDLNGDALPDLVLGGDGGNYLQVLRNQGGGVFEPDPTDVYLGDPSGSEIAVNDLNGDGRPDLVFANPGVRVLLHQEDGSFADPVDYEVDSPVTTLAIADVTGDGSADIVLVDQGSGDLAGHLRVLVNHGDGSFTAAADFAAGLHPHAIVASDLNGDGAVDLAVASTGAKGNDPDVLPDCDLLVFNNQGDGTFAAPQISSLGGGANRLAVTDVNGDGVPDLLALGVYASCLRVLENQGGGFVSDGCFPTGGGAIDVSAADLNGDGRMDALVPKWNAPDVAFLFNTCSP